MRHRQLSLPPGVGEAIPQPRPGAVPPRGAPGELEGNRRPSGQRRGCFQRSQVSCLFDGTWCGMCTWERLVTVDWAALEPSSLLDEVQQRGQAGRQWKRVPAFNGDNQSNGKCETLQCMPAFNDRDACPSWLLELLVNHTYLLDYYPDHCILRIHCFSYCTYQVCETLFSIQSKLLLED